MAYRIEKEEGSGDVIVIDGWNGIAPDPYSGTNRMFSVNLTVPNEVSVGYPITESTLSGGGSSLGTPIARSTRWFTYGTPGVPSGSPSSYAVLDENGRVWESTSIAGTWTFLSSSNSVTNSTINDGIAFWLGYLFKTRTSAIDYWNGTTWANLTLNGGASTGTLGGYKHFMYVGTDNVLYITNGNYIATIELVDPSAPTGFNPANTATFTFTGQKLQLPATDEAISLAEVGSGNSPNSTLLIGGVQNLIYPWDKTSPNFALPIVVGDSYIKNMVTVNQNAFVFPGNQQGRGRIYITNGSQAEEWIKMPDYIFGVQDPFYVWGDAIFHRNQLLFGCFVVSNAGTVQLVAQVFAADLDTKVLRGVSNIPAAQTAKANAVCLLSSWNASSAGLGYMLAWDDDATAPAIGYSNGTAGIGSASITTDLIPVGTFTFKKTFTQVEYKLRTPLASGESISITPVVDGTSGSALSFQPTVTTGALSGIANVNFQGAQWLQFTVSLTGNSGSSGVRLKELRVR